MRGFVTGFRIGWARTDGQQRYPAMRPSSSDELETTMRRKMGVVGAILDGFTDIMGSLFDGFMGCLALFLEIGLKLAFLVIAIVIALAIYHALFGH